MVRGPLRIADLPEEAEREVLQLYNEMGGKGPPMFRPGGWDLVFGDGELLIELDEELHFNRYRAMTLHASWIANLPWTEDYLRYCDEEEPKCLSAGSWGKRWTNDSCERMFGPAGRPGDLAEPGAPRWKQRAFYDALKDTVPLTSLGVRLARLSVYDTVDGHLLGAILEGAPADPAAVRALVEWRTT